MNRQELLSFHQKLCDELRAIASLKNSDYTGSSSDPFFNLTLAERLNICSTEQGILVRMTDKMSRISSLLQSTSSQKVKDESIEDTLADLINYSILLFAYLRSKKNKVVPLK